MTDAVQRGDKRYAILCAMKISDRKYRKWRAAILAEEPLCRLCAEQGITMRAVELDHIKRRTDSPELLMERKNVQPLCAACHEAKTVEENKTRFKGWGCDEEGNLLKSWDYGKRDI